MPSEDVVKLSREAREFDRQIKLRRIITQVMAEFITPQGDTFEIADALLDRLDQEGFEIREWHR